MDHSPASPNPAGHKPHSFLTHPLIVALLTIVLILAGLEWMARQPWFQSAFPYESRGFSNILFDIKWQKLQQYVAENGGVDVIFVGHSLVNTGIDPSVMRSQIQDQTGQDLRIFNFGVEGIPISGTSYIAKILAETYHPAVIVYAAEIRDFRSGIGDGATSELLANAWFQYKLGQNNPLGWLIDHSEFLRRFLASRDWMLSGFYTNHTQFPLRTKSTHVDGYEPDHAVSMAAYSPMDPNDERDAFLIDLLATYSIDADRAQTLQSLLTNVSAAGTLPVVIEWPFPDSVFETPGGEEAYQLFSQELDAVLAGNGGRRLPGMPWEEIPEDGRADRYHLNEYGAGPFSAYIARVFIEQGMVDQIVDCRNVEGQ